MEYDQTTPYQNQLQQEQPKADARKTINAIMYVLITDIRWIDLHPKHGSSAIDHSKIYNKKEYGKRFSNVSLRLHINQARLI